MGPRLRVDNDLFVERVSSSKNKVVVTKKEAFAGSTYIVRDGDYYYYTKSKKPLELPAGTVIENVHEALL